MKEILKYSGAIIIILAVAVFCVYQFAVQNNSLLFVALIMMIVGLIAQVVVPRFLED